MLPTKRGIFPSPPGPSPQAWLTGEARLLLPPGVKLPGLLSVNGSLEPITVLECVLRAEDRERCGRCEPSSTPRFGGGCGCGACPPLCYLTGLGKL